MGIIFQRKKEESYMRSKIITSHPQASDLGLQDKQLNILFDTENIIN